MKNLSSSESIRDVVITNNIVLAKTILETLPKSSHLKLWRFAIRYNKIDIFNMCINDSNGNININTHSDFAFTEALDYRNYDIIDAFIKNKNYKLSLETLGFFLPHDRILLLQVFNYKPLFNKINNKEELQKLLIEAKVENF